MGMLLCKAVYQFPERINKDFESQRAYPNKELPFSYKKEQAYLFWLLVSVIIPKKWKNVSVLELGQR